MLERRIATAKSKSNLHTVGGESIMAWEDGSGGRAR